MDCSFYLQFDMHPFQHGFISPKAIKWYAKRWNGGVFDLDLDWYDEDYEYMERKEMAYEEALIRHKDSWEKRHKAMVRYKESHHYNSFTVECPMNKKKAIMGLPLPESLLKMIYDYIYPYKVSHVSYEFSLFRCRMKRQGKMNKTIERYWKAVDPTIYKFDHPSPYYDYQEELEELLIKHLKYINNKKETGVVCGPLRRYDEWDWDNAASRVICTSLIRRI